MEKVRCGKCGRYVPKSSCLPYRTKRGKYAGRPSWICFECYITCEDDIELLTPDWNKIQNKIQELIDILHEELGWFNSEELKNTARRIANFYKEWASNQSFKFTTFERDLVESKLDQLIVYRDIKFFSMCSHHMLPFYGVCHVAYLPRDEVAGASKIARMVVAKASKPQIQEKLTDEICRELFDTLKAKFVMVVMEATHLCMVCRGIKQYGSKMVTSSIRYDKEAQESGEIDWKTLKEESLILFRGLRQDF